MDGSEDYGKTSPEGLDRPDYVPPEGMVVWFSGTEKGRDSEGRNKGMKKLGAVLAAITAWIFWRVVRLARELRNIKYD